METIKLEPLDEDQDQLEELNDAGRLLELQFGEDRLSARANRSQSRKNIRNYDNSASSSDSSACRLCCLSVSRLTSSVNDKTIVDLFNFVPELVGLPKTR